MCKLTKNLLTTHDLLNFFNWSSIVSMNHLKMFSTPSNFDVTDNNFTYQSPIFVSAWTIKNCKKTMHNQNSLIQKSDTTLSTYDLLETINAKFTELQNFYLHFSTVVRKKLKLHILFDHTKAPNIFHVNFSELTLTWRLVNKYAALLDIESEL